ncbi:protein of unknown function [Cupriavidus taiwanensis]|uniref:Uncharacterized protein n=1 Tax=Cupriavidus taiwanensis TaxID=164546 RepID=A0A375IBT4_9BURK|nr:protein of unknown function [Cupriavidus taiwanensis]
MLNCRACAPGRARDVVGVRPLMTSLSNPSNFGVPAYCS